MSRGGGGFELDPCGQEVFLELAGRGCVVCINLSALHWSYCPDNHGIARRRNVIIQILLGLVLINYRCESLRCPTDDIIYFPFFCPVQ